MFKLFCLIFIFSSTCYAIDFDLSTLNEDSFLGPKKESRLLPLEDSHHPFNKNKEPLILVHGIRGNPSDMQAIVDRMKDSRFQIYVLAYADFKVRTSINGKTFSEEIKKLTHKKFTIVAHSMGGIVSRKALADLVASESLSEKSQIRLFTIDTPWHGFNGPSDEEGFGFKLMMAKPFLPDGLEDMRAKSNFFKDLNKVKFPASITVDICFAEEGDQAFDYSDKLTDPHQRINLERALELTGKLQEAKATSFQQVFPKFPGNHVSVITENGFSSNYLDYLERQLQDNI